MSHTTLAVPAPTRLAPALALAGLVAFADFLFWADPPGLSLALFALAVFAAATWPVRPRAALLRPLLLLVVAALPVVEMVQALSVAFLATGLVLSLVWAHGSLSPGTALSFALALPRRWLAPLNPVRNLRVLRTLPTGTGTIRRQVALWAFPLGGSAIFIALLADANPVLARIFSVEIELGTAFERLLFWGGTALLLAPFLAPLPEAAPLRLRLPAAGLNAGSVTRALVLFNAVIGLQTLTDLSILVAGADLPAGMSFADYAHRGAYPLLATAILAGAFAIAARPFLESNAAVRPMLALWLVQNVILCGAAAMRLDLYIGAYGLTYLRLHALIWMGLVAAGLALGLWQILARRSTPWLLARVSALAVAVLYVCCFLNVAQIIASQNLARPTLDPNYVCDLGPMAAVAWAEAANRPPPSFRLGSCPARHAPVTRGWRDWGFRAWRVRHTLAALEGHA
ncbi:MAG: DUF4173 domain-containing protein [Rhodobacteraceae bacterium]|nr:DUF4173 domain-containing protein [Paracoccaceae bacterium]